MTRLNASFACLAKILSGSNDCSIKSRAEEVITIWTPILIRAARLGHLNCVKYFVEQCNADIEEVGSVCYYELYESGASALWASAAGGHLDIAEYLISKGANVNTTTNSNSTPLLAASSQGRLDLVKLLLEKGADIEVSDHLGNTCLITASYGGHIKVVKYLLGIGADLNRKRIDGKSALHVCVQSGYLEVVKVLLDYGASMDADSSGETPLFAASFIGHAHIVEHFIATRDSMSTEEKIMALEVLGTTFYDKMQDTASAVKYWNKAMHERCKKGITINPDADNPLHSEHFKEVTTPQQLEEIRDDRDAVEMHSLLVKARVLGPGHRATIEAIKNKGAELAANGDMKRCMVLWMHALEAQQKTLGALDPKRLIFLTALTDLFTYMAFVQPLHYEILMYSEDIMHLFENCIKEIEKGTSVVRKVKVTGKIVDFFYIDRIFPLAMKLLLLLITLEPSLSSHKMHSVKCSVFKLVKLNSSDSTGATILHFACSDVVFSNVDSPLTNTFPSLKVLNLLLETGANPCVRDYSGNTPLHALAKLSEIPSDMLEVLLAAGAHLDAKNSQGQTFGSLRASLSLEWHQIVNPVRHTSLQCLAAATIRRHGIPYKGVLHTQLLQFVDFH